MIRVSSPSRYAIIADQRCTPLRPITCLRDSPLSDHPRLVDVLVLARVVHLTVGDAIAVVMATRAAGATHSTRRVGLW